MMSHNHFLVAFTLLLAFFQDQASILTLAAFAMIFGVFPDLDLFFTIVIKKRKHKTLRTWFQEPYGFFVIALPLGFLLGRINPLYFYFVTIPFASHILADYITYHHTHPFKPFSEKTYITGFIKPLSAAQGLSEKKGFPEHCVTILLLITIILIL